MVTGVTRDQESSAAPSERKQMLVRLSTEGCGCHPQPYSILADSWDKCHLRAKLETSFMRRSDIKPPQDLKSLNNAFEALMAFSHWCNSASYSKGVSNMLMRAS